MTFGFVLLVLLDFFVVFCFVVFFFFSSPSKTLLLVREGLVKIIGSSYMSKFFFSPGILNFGYF